VKETLVRGLIEQWSALDALLSELSDDDWNKPSPLPGWTVHDVVAHIIGGEMGLAGKQPPVLDDGVRTLPHVRNDIGAINEWWVLGLRTESPARMLGRFRDITAERAKVLTAMSEEEFFAPSWTPSGQDTYARYMRIRLFDCWMHEQDIRDSVGRQGNEDGPGVRSAFDEITAALGYIVGKRAGVPSGSSVTIELTGPVERALHVLVDGRAKVVAELPAPATTTLTLSSSLFTRLAGGRVPAADRLGEIKFDGDEELGHRVVHALPFTI